MYYFDTFSFLSFCKIKNKDFFQTIASAPPVRDLNNSKRNGGNNSQNVRFAMDGTNNNRMSRRTSLKNKRSNTASNVRPNSRLTTRNRNGKSLESKRSPSDDRKRSVL